MVARLSGTVNGYDIVFSKKAGDVWEAVIPPRLDGTYVVSLQAWDDAGNYAYTAKYILTFDPSQLCVHLIKCPYQAELTEDVYSSQLMARTYYAGLMESKCAGR